MAQYKTIYFKSGRASQKSSFILVENQRLRMIGNHKESSFHHDYDAFPSIQKVDIQQR